jgi:hypothetical protein
MPCASCHEVILHISGHTLVQKRFSIIGKPNMRSALGNSLNNQPEFVIPAPHRVRDKLQRESRQWNSTTELLDARLRGHDVMVSFSSYTQWSDLELFWSVMILCY